MQKTSPSPTPRGAAEDEQLVGRAKAGDREAFGELVRKYARVVRALVRARLGSGPEADDAAQETFLVAYRRLGGLSEPSRFAGWLSRIAVNKALEHIRRESRRPAGSLDTIELDPEAPAEPDQLERDEEVARMLRHVGELDEKTQLVLTLRFLEGLAVQDIAARVGDKPPATAMRISRALRRLRASLEAEE